MARGMSRINSIDVRVQETVPRPNLSWETGSFSLDNIYKKFTLPRVIQCDSVLAKDVTRERSNFDFLQPMLLYKRRDCMKVAASSLNIDNRTGKTVEIGDCLLVPEDYKGWFAVLNPKTRNKPVPHYKQVAQLAQSNCDTFLIGGSEYVVAVQKIRKDSQPVQRLLYPGDVLRMGGVYAATTEVKASRFSKVQMKEEIFLLCIDQNDREVLLPIESNGMFYIVKNKFKQTKVPIGQMKDIISNTKLPCEVKLIFGRLPTTPCSFTGMLVLKNAYLESSVVASSIVNLRNILLEIPTDIPMKFRVAVNDNALLENKGYQNAIKLCQEKAETYMRNIKVSQQLTDTDTAPEQREQEVAPSDTVRAPLSQGTPIPAQSVPTLPQKHISNKTAVTNECTLPQKSRTARGVPLFQPKSHNPCQPQYPVPNMIRPPLPPKASVSSGSESAESSNDPPQPPPQSSKPTTLDRVVVKGLAPPLVRIRQIDGTNRKSQVSQYEEVWLDSQPVQNTVDGAPPPSKESQYDQMGCEPGQNTPKILPQKCLPSPSTPLLRQKSITISVNGGYLTVPVYPTQGQEDSSSKVAMSVSDKINFWKTMDETNQAVSISESPGTGNFLTRNTSVTFSECGFKTKDQRDTKEKEPTGKIYENIEELRQFRTESLNENALQSSNNNIDNVVYEPIDAFDDLSVGATANRLSSTDSGIMDDRTDEVSVDCSPAVTGMTVAEVYENLKEVGVSKKTRQYLKKEKVDGRLLTAFGEDAIIATFPTISKLEAKKIVLFVKGWKPV